MRRTTDCLGTLETLSEGKGYLFHDAGEFALKGYEHAVHLFDVKWEGE